MTTPLSSMLRFNFILKRWHKAAVVSFLFFVLGLIALYSQTELLKIIFVVVLVLFVIASFFWLEKKENYRRRIAKYSLPFSLVVLTSGYAMIFPPSFWSVGVILFSAIGFYFFASRLKIPLPFHVREAVTYYWLDMVIYWVAFLSFLVLYYFFFYLLNFSENWRYFAFSISLLVFSFYLVIFSLWARNRHYQEIIFYGFVFDLVLAEFLLLWGFYKMSPIGGSLLFVLLLYFFLENLNIFFRYQFIRQKDIIRLTTLILLLGGIVFLFFRPFTLTGF